jgi:hypothetical protein
MHVGEFETEDPILEKETIRDYNQDEEWNIKNIFYQE